MRLDVDDVLHERFGVPGAVRCDQSERLPVQVHRVGLHARVPHDDTGSIALLEAQRIGVRVDLAVDRPDVASHHAAAQRQLERACRSGRRGQHRPAPAEPVLPQPQAGDVALGLDGRLPFVTVVYDDHALTRRGVVLPRV